MSRIGLVLATAALGAVLVPVAAGAADAPTYNRIKGEGSIGIADVNFTAANTAPSGSAATGTFSGKNQAMTLNGPITCLQVDGKRAGFIYTADKTSQPEPLQGQSFLITIEDYSPGGTGNFGFMPLQSGADLKQCAPGQTFITASSGHFSVSHGAEVSDNERNARHDNGDGGGDGKG